MSDAVSFPESRLAPVARTARWTAAARARESRRADRLFDDPYAEVLAGEDGAFLLRHFENDNAPSTGNPLLAIRTRWFDDVLTAAAARGARQIVGLGAGLDVRAYRLDWPDGAVLFEVDQPAVLAYKEQVLAASGAEPRCEVRRVGANLTVDWVSRLTEAGYDRSVSTVWFVEGLLFYLPDRLAHDVLARAAELSAPGGVLAADILSTALFRFPYLKPLLRKLEEAHSPWVFGTDAPGEFLAACGWRPTVVTEPGRPGADYGRWPPRANPPGIADLPRSFLVSAAKA